MLSQPRKKFTLGDKGNRVCRFCGRSEFDVSFKKKAHAIPEALGNKSIFTYYECDGCNQYFGQTIENDLGNWSKPNRTFARICGRNGVPKLKESGRGKGWRIEYLSNCFHITHYESNPLFSIDTENKRVRFDLKRDVYTPVAVLKAFVKIGLTLLPAEEMPNFYEALNWIREPDHTKTLVKKFPIFQTFRPGPMRSDRVAVMLFRRNNMVTNIPYAFIVLTYGNDMFQVFLPCPKQDQTINAQNQTIPIFCSPRGPGPALYGKPRVKVLDLCGQEVIRDERVQVVLGLMR